MLTIWKFSETSPTAPGVAASSQAVAGSAGPAGTASGQMDDYQALIIEAVLVGATGGTLDVYMQNSPDQGVTWYDYAHFPQLAAGAAAVAYVATVATGAQNLTLATIGSGLTPALAAGTVTGGAWGDRFRVLMVAGSGTTAGAAVSVRIVGQRTNPWSSRAG